MFWILSLYQVICKYFLPLPRLYFYFLIMSFDVQRFKF